jgi:seryl-tRNA(Sec) selenium transferase
MATDERLDLDRVINACTRMTALGGAILSGGVVAATSEAARAYGDVAAPRWRPGKRVAERPGAPDGGRHPVRCAPR